MGSALADSVRTIPHIKCFDDMAANRFNGLDLSSLIPYFIDTAPSAALPFIAEAFDVLGFRGWKFADTDAKQRALLKIALQLHMIAGTPQSVINALNSIGYTVKEIVEGISLKYDGEAFFDGQYNYGSGSWADFAVVIDASTFTTITQTDIDNMTGVILAWKPARSTLIGVWFGVDLIDTLANNDTVSMNIITISPSTTTPVTF